MIIPHVNLGQIGVVGDQNGQALPVNAWTDSMNVRFTQLGVEKIAESRLKIRSEYKLDIFTTKVRYGRVYLFGASKNGLHVYNGEQWNFTPAEKDPEDFWQYTHWGDTVIFNCPSFAPFMFDWDAYETNLSALFKPLPKWGMISTSENLENGEDPGFDTDLRCQRLLSYKSQLVAVGVSYQEEKLIPTPARDPLYAEDAPTEYESGVQLENGDQWYVVTDPDFDYDNPDPSGLAVNIWSSEESVWEEPERVTERLVKDNVVWVSDTTSDPTYKVPEGAAGGGADAGVTGAVAGGPPSWDYVSPATLSVQQVVGASDGRYIAAELLNESVIIYTATAAHALVFTGGQYVVQTRRLFQRGCAGRQCVVEFSGNHFVIDGDQLYIHDGSQATRVGEDMFDVEFFKRAVNLGTATLCHDPENREILIYFDTKNGRKSCIYSYATGTFGWGDGEAQKSPITYATRGYLHADGATWEEMSSTWAELREPFSGESRDRKSFSRLIKPSWEDQGALMWRDAEGGWEDQWASGGGTERPDTPASEGYRWVDVASSTRKPRVLALTQLGIHQKEAFFGTDRDCWLERKAIDLDDAGINGWTIKHLRQYHMQIAGEGTLGIRTGWAESALAEPNWEKPVWLDEKGVGAYQADMRTSGRYLSLRFEFKQMGEFRWANGYMDIEVSGRR
jgi:hypothetical protein